MNDKRPDEERNLNELITKTLAIEIEDAKRSGNLGFMARALAQATMPHKMTPGCEFKRQNGLFRLSILSPSDIGLPYGSIPRLLVAWITTEAVRTHCPELELGPSLSSFMAQLDLVPTGGRWGSITRLRNQMMRLFASSITCVYEDEKKAAIFNVKVVEEALLWWDPKQPDQAALWNSTIKLGDKFFQEIIHNPIPIDMHALKELKQSPMALDIYCWLTHRMSYLQKETEIPWSLLQSQFGADYANNAQGLRDFKKKFLKQLRNVVDVYPEAKAGQGKRGIILKPSPPHVPMEPPGLHAIKGGGQPPRLATFPNSHPKLTLLPGTFEKAKQMAPRADIYAAFAEWLGWIEDTGQQPEHPDAAFLGFVRKKFSVVASHPDHPLPPRRLVLEPLTLELAKNLVRGHDISGIEQAWREHLAATGQRPDDPNTDFLDFCGQYVQKHR
jgi:replication initiator protein